MKNISKTITTNTNEEVTLDTDSLDGVSMINIAIFEGRDDINQFACAQLTIKQARLLCDNLNLLIEHSAVGTRSVAT